MKIKYRFDEIFIVELCHINMVTPIKEDVKAVTFTPVGEKGLAIYDAVNNQYIILSKKVKVALSRELLYDEKYFAKRAYHLPRKFIHKKLTEEQLIQIENELNKKNNDLNLEK